MLSKITLSPPNSCSFMYNKFGCSTRIGSSRFTVASQFQGDKWKINDIDPTAVQERLSSWVSKTQNFLNGVTLTFNSPLVKSGDSGKPDNGATVDAQQLEEIFMAEQTIHSTTPNGILSVPAIVSIEQFSRMNGLTGYKSQKIFKALVNESANNDARNLVEYCCFRFLSRDNSAIHPCLKEPAFQRLIFITMHAWENPYRKENDSEKASFQGMLVGEEAFVRIAPAISGIADRSTVHNLFRALAGDQQGISLGTWVTYVDELLKVHAARKSYETRESTWISDERILCIGSSKKRPVVKWENNMAWPGKVILTDKALYFEAFDLRGKKDSVRLDLTTNEIQVEKTKVGPFGFVRFDSAVSISSGPKSETWVLEFVDLGSELRRDVWHAFINEVISLHKFIYEFGPEEGDQSINQVYGAQKGKERATTSAINSIARLQALQFTKKLLDDPIKLVQFSYLQNVPYGAIVYQSLAVNYWGGALVKKYTDTDYQPSQVAAPSGEVLEISNHAYDIDGSVYLQKWKRSPSWESSASINFWKNSSINQGIVLSKNLVVADVALVERAAMTCKEKCQLVEITQATIDAATLKGIPSNIDLFKELMLPLTMIAKNIERLRRWEEPHLTISFLAFSYLIIFRNLLPYIFPMMLMVLAAAMLTLKGLKDQGRLGRFFGKVTIRDQPPSNTIQKIIALRDAMQDVENYLQNMNVTLLKIRTIFLAGYPQITTEVAMVLFASAAILLVIPFKYVAACLLFDFFTRELEFRREMAEKFATFLKERWDTVPAAPVAVLPYESKVSKQGNQQKKIDEQTKKKL
uniref:GRAM domain-containing protein n=1 Tax=Salix viminalis TaxID=40686 RepID=A0A6N2M8W7_SALVM